MTQVTVYIPCYNAAHFLPEVLPALFRQTLKPAEILVVDDGSTDNTVQVAERFLKNAPCPARVVRQVVNKGLGAARNRGVREAEHAFVASVDADVCAEPGWLEALVTEIETPVNGEPVAGVGGELIEHYTRGPANRWRDTHMRQSWGGTRLERPPFLFGANTLFRRDVLLAAGLYDERCRTNAEDVKLCEAIRDKHVLVYNPSARCRHLRRDTLRSILRTAWKWHFYGNHSPVSVSANFLSNWRHARRYAGLLRMDAGRGRLSNACLDVAGLFFACFMDWSFYFQAAGKGSRA